jgi:hypothetical protein
MRNIALPLICLFILAACGPGPICGRGSDTDAGTATDATPPDMGSPSAPLPGGAWGPCVAGSPPTCDAVDDTCYLEADGPDLLSLCVPAVCGSEADIAGDTYVLDATCHPTCAAPEDCYSSIGLVCGDDGVCAWISATP